MEIRGRRECQNCGARWSYYETGSVDCPNCGSVHSRGLDDERSLHTASPRSLDLTDARSLVDERPLREVAERAAEACREYVLGQGFVDAGSLLDLNDEHLAARELLHVADEFARAFDPTETEELYFLSLLREADAGERPDPSDVPDSIRAARGLAYANAVRAYRRDVDDWLDARESASGTDGADDAPARRALSTLSEHVTRVRALEGDVDPQTSETLVAAVRELAASLRDGDEAALATARDRLDRLERLDRLQ